jgi:O-antigen biosynthesis alpha-1,2-mannosyltransferase
VAIAHLPTIAVDLTYALDPQPSGIAVYSRRLMETMVALETPYRFLACYRLSRWRQRQRVLRSPRRSGGRPAFSTRFFQQGLTFWLPWQADLFHSLAQRPPAFRFQREVVTVLDVFPITGRDYSTAEFQRKFGALLREAVARAGRVITLSEYTAGQLVEHCGTPRERIRVVPAGVDLPERSMRVEERLRERERLVGEGNEMVLSVGVIQTRKNTLGAVRALAHLPERYHLVLAGGMGYGSEAVLEGIRRQGMGPRVSLLGYVPAEQLPALYQAASAFLFPSLEEGFGFPVLEAMAHGVPVVTSTSSSLPEVGGPAALYADPRDARDLASKVRDAVENTELRVRMIQHGLERAREFTWRRAAQSTLAVYGELLKV